MSLPVEQWKLVEASVPIVCVDVLPWSISAGGDLQIGLIRREDESGDYKWNLVGGRVRIDETVSQAITRHVVETLGSKMRWERSDFRFPETVCEYLRLKEEGFGFDPRHHAIGLSYTLKCEGNPVPGGEAVGFEYFGADELPEAGEIGFNQGSVVYELAKSVLRQMGR